MYQDQQHHHQLTVDLQIGPMTNGVMTKTTMLIATGMVGLVVIMTLVNGTHIVQLVNVLIPLLVGVQIVKTNGRPKSVKKGRTRENVTVKKLRRTAKKPVACARQASTSYINPFAFC